MLHGDIAGRNLCILDNGEVSIIDFSHAGISSDEEDKETEFAELCEELEMDYDEALAALRTLKTESSSLRRSEMIQASIAEAEAQAQVQDEVIPVPMFSRRKRKHSTIAVEAESEPRPAKKGKEEEGSRP